MTSIRRHPSTLPMRPIPDKDLEVVDLDQLFEEYVETDLLQQLNYSTAERSSSGDLAHLFDLPSSTDGGVPTGSPLVDQDHRSWQPCSQRLYQDPASFSSNDSSSFCITPKTKESLSDSELLNFEHLFELEQNQLRSISQPSTPRLQPAKAVKKAVSFQEKAAPRGIYKLKKSPSSSFATGTKMMHPSAYFQRASVPEFWTHKIDAPAQAFNLRTAPHNIHSPPPSAKIKHESESCFFPQGRPLYTDETSPLTSPDPNAHGLAFTGYHMQLTPDASPSVDASNTDRNDGHYNMGNAFSAPVQDAALSALHTPPSSIPLSMTTWSNDPSPNLGLPYSQGFVGSTKDAADVWGVHDELHPQTDAALTCRESNVRTTSQQNLSYSYAGEPTGLGITCDNSSFTGFEGLGLSNAHEQHMPPSASSASASSYEMGNCSYGSMYPTPPQQHMVPIGQPPLSRTPSPNPQPRFHRRRPSTQSHNQHHRAVSTQRRKSSTNSTQTRQASTGSAGAGFVNYTPNDSRKILTGVAPSGSSKTKARREKEAQEKRRKLSQAAMRAVIEAGGNVDNLRKLEREGLLVLESVDLNNLKGLGVFERGDSAVGFDGVKREKFEEKFD